MSRVPYVAATNRIIGRLQLRLPELAQLIDEEIATAISEEREACASLADSHTQQDDYGGAQTARRIAARIRDRRVL